MDLHQVLDVRLAGAPYQVVQKRLMGVNGVNPRAEFLRQRQRLPTGTATGINDDPELLFWQQTQDMQSMSVVAGTEFCQTAKE
jgi:hypothetical protein